MPLHCDLLCYLVSMDIITDFPPFFVRFLSDKIARDLIPGGALDLTQSAHCRISHLRVASHSYRMSVSQLYVFANQYATNGISLNMVNLAFAGTRVFKSGHSELL